MADLTIATNALTAGSTYPPSLQYGTAGANMDAGTVLALNPTTSKYVAADANGADAYLKVVVGILMHDVVTDAPISFINGGSLILTAILTAGVIYVLSDDAGKICPASDLATGHNVCILGVAISTTHLRVHLFNSEAVF